MKIKFPPHKKTTKMTLLSIRKDLKQYSSPQKAQKISSFFKTFPGSYGFGDIFIGVRVPELRLIMKKHHMQITQKDIKALLMSPIHEERFLALLFMIQIYQQKAQTDHIQSSIIRLYLKNARRVNSWDLVDLSAHALLGHFLWSQEKNKLKKSFPLLKKLVQSPNLWERRIAMVSTWFFIKRGHLQSTFELAKLLMKDTEDLMHKAVGWMLREAGKKNQSELIAFLKNRYQMMPRTMLRYALEKFPKDTYQRYLNNQI